MVAAPDAACHNSPPPHLLTVSALVSLPPPLVLPSYVQIAVRAAADQACQALARLLHPEAVPRCMPAILSGASPAKKWQCKEGAFKIISTLCETAPDAVQAALPDIVPVVRACMCVRGGVVEGGMCVYGMCRGVRYVYGYGMEGQGHGLGGGPEAGVGGWG